MQAAAGGRGEGGRQADAHGTLLRVDDLHGAPPQRERGHEYVLVLVSEHFDGVPWLERVYQAGSLWDALEMGAAAEVHCYTPAEFERKREQLKVVRQAADHGLELLPEPA